jgi:hypothetical protein
MSYLDSEDFEDEFPINLGTASAGHVRAFWATDRNGERAAIVVAHKNATGEICASSIFVKPFAGRRALNVVSMEPLSISQEIQCDCGLTGFIIKGRWNDS